MKKISIFTIIFTILMFFTLSIFSKEVQKGGVQIVKIPTVAVTEAKLINWGAPLCNFEEIAKNKNLIVSRIIQMGHRADVAGVLVENLVSKATVSTIEKGTNLAWIYPNYRDVTVVNATPAWSSQADVDGKRLTLYLINPNTIAMKVQMVPVKKEKEERKEIKPEEKKITITPVITEEKKEEKVEEKKVGKKKVPVTLKNVLLNPHKVIRDHPASILAYIGAAYGIYELTKEDKEGKPSPPDNRGPIPPVVYPGSPSEPPRDWPTQNPSEPPVTILTSGSSGNANPITIPDSGSTDSGSTGELIPQPSSDFSGDTISETGPIPPIVQPPANF